MASLELFLGHRPAFDQGWRSRPGRHVKGDRLAKAGKGVIDIEVRPETTLGVEAPKRCGQQRADLAGVPGVDGDSVEKFTKLLEPVVFQRIECLRGAG